MLFQFLVARICLAVAIYSSEILLEASKTMHEMCNYMFYAMVEHWFGG